MPLYMANCLNIEPKAVRLNYLGGDTEIVQTEGPLREIKERYPVWGLYNQDIKLVNGKILMALSYFIKSTCVLSAGVKIDNKIEEAKMANEALTERFTRTGTQEYLSSWREALENNVGSITKDSESQRLIQENIMFLKAAIVFLDNADLDETFVKMQ